MEYTCMLPGQGQSEVRAKKGGTMRHLVMATAGVLFVGLVGMPKAVRAATFNIGVHTPDYVKNHCQGGHFDPPSKTGAYGCQAQDGSGIVCGGPGKYKNVCTTWG